jgi:hypothetical protein
MSHVFPTFQSLVDSVIRLEYKRRELGEQKRKATSQGQSGSERILMSPREGGGVNRRVLKITT